MPAEAETNDGREVNGGDTAYPSASNTHDNEKPQSKQITYDSADGLMAQGPDALHAHLAEAVETSIGREIPQTEIRFHHLSLTADIQLAKENSDKPELPTLWNEFYKSVAGMLGLSGKTTVQKHILQDVSGAFKPGTITLVMGQPGSGKSAFMKVLGGCFPMRKNISLEGDITFNGKSYDEIKDHLPQYSAYVTQKNYLHPTMTVKETLEFAQQCVGHDVTNAANAFSKGSPEENEKAIAVAKAMYENHPDVAIRQLGLKNCQDTIVGDEMMRGVSGGEKKRVTTGEMQFGLKNVALMDEITTGLDSAAAYDIVKTQRSIARRLKKTVVISLLQPTPEVFDLFDDIMIFSEGRVMYFGPREEAVPYFSTIGFHCPEDRDSADFLMDLNTNQQKYYEVDDGHVSPPQSGREFADRFQESKYSRKIDDDLDGEVSRERKEDFDDYMSYIPRYWEPFWPSTWKVVKREMLLLTRNKAFVRGHGVMIVIMALLLSSTFYQVTPTDSQVMMGVLFQAVLFVSLGMASQIPTYMKARGVFYRQRGAHMYRTVSYVLGTSISQFPMAVFDALSFGSLVYWMCGLNPEVGTFIIYLIILFLTNLALCAWFFFLVAASPNTNVAMPMAMMSINIFVIFAGFIVPKGQIPDYFIWLYWLSPISWSIRSLAVNEYHASRYTGKCHLENVDIDFCKTGQSPTKYLLSLFEVPSDKAWVVNGIIYLIVIYIVFMMLSSFFLEYMRYEAPENVSFTEEEKREQAAKHNHAGEEYAEVATPAGSGSQVVNPADAVVEVNNEELNFTPVNLAFKDLWYTVEVPGKHKGEKSTSLDLLKGVTGFALPGTMTALMGSTGAGKTTLMDVIAGRKTGGKIGGDILLNGHPASALAIQRATGYCEQMDIHADSTTFREALTFSAFLRQSADVPDSVKYDSVNECLDLLDMHEVADQIVRGGSTEQMKRLTIGVELAAQPSILFLDEPTSGLDAHSAKVIMDGVRNVANSGRTIVCTIHQPSTEVFMLFDKLLLLQRGGRMVYFGDLGDNCSTLINYFEDMDHTQPMTKGYNPANWMLECIGAGVDNNIADEVDFESAFNKSELCRVLDSSMEKDGVLHPSPDMAEVSFERKRASKSSVQASMLVKRFMDQYWRTPTYNLTRIIVALVLSLLFGLLFVSNSYDTYQGIVAGVGVIFTAVLFNSMIAFNNILSISCAERAVFYRERSAQTYNALWYFIGTTVAEIPYTYASMLLFTVIFFPMVGFVGFTNGVIFWLSLSTLVLLQTYMGQFLAYGCPSEEVANLAGVVLNVLFILFMGFNPPADGIPSGYKWIYKIAPHRYAFSACISVVFGNCDDLPVRLPGSGEYDLSTGGSDLGCTVITQPGGSGQVTVKEFVEDKYGADHSKLVRDFSILVGYIVGFRILALICLRFINHQKR